MKLQKSIDLSALPEQARQVACDFYLFIKQRNESRTAAGECALLRIEN